MKQICSATPTTGKTYENHMYTLTFLYHAAVVSVAFYKTATSTPLVLSWQRLNNLKLTLAIAIILFFYLPASPSVSVHLLNVLTLCSQSVLHSLQSNNQIMAPVSLCLLSSFLSQKRQTCIMSPSFQPYTFSVSSFKQVLLCLILTEPGCQICQMDRACQGLDLQACQG